MAPITQASDETNHQALLDKLDVYATPKPFRNSHWRPQQRRNKNVKTIINDASRKEASMMATPTQNNSGASTPMLPHSDIATAGDRTPLYGGPTTNIAQAAQRLDRLVLEKTLNQGVSTMSAMNGPVVTYTNIESAPSLHPSSQRHYCDITGLPAPYTDPKTRLRYHNAEIFRAIRGLGQGSTEGYLAARGAHTVLK
jgi:INO80 complex subunit C